MTASILHFSLLSIMYLISFEVDTGAAFVMRPTAPLVQKLSIYTEAGKRKRVLKLQSESHPENNDTVRVKIWRALVSSKGEEMTLKQLGAIVGERRTGELRTHLQHVEKQAKTLRNKNVEWRERRGLSGVESKPDDKIRIRIRRGKKNKVYIKLG
mmetsp:Transcript_20977/g.44269  ORF Transcript_20977/g.44269 Transcript_20977/m.44269 type:complete len:155 (+) Transcript_20977:134-598(+)